MKIGAAFLNLSETVVWLAGHFLVLAGAAALVVVWCAVGFALGLPKEWHLLSAMFGTLVTLFLLLIMQHSQNRDMAALQVKVDELIRSSEAGNHMIGIERLEAEELERLAENQTT